MSTNNNNSGKPVLQIPDNKQNPEASSKGTTDKNKVVPAPSTSKDAK